MIYWVFSSGTTAHGSSSNSSNSKNKGSLTQKLYDLQIDIIEWIYFNLWHYLNVVNR